MANVIQLSLYAGKFEQFQETLNRSNEVFTTFKQEMERVWPSYVCYQLTHLQMTKTIKKSEKENLVLRKKCEQTDYTLIELAEEVCCRPFTPRWLLALTDT